MSQDLTCTDHFCGAGGATEGLKAAGVIVVEAANHWNLAVETYNANHPDTRVHLADLSATDPRRFQATDLAWFSPECTTFSQAAPTPAQRRARRPSLFDGTQDEGVVRSRVTMGDVIRFTAHHRYRTVMVENVVDIGRWELIDDWIGEMVKLGYRWQAVSLNSMVAWPTPQSRDRLYFVFSRLEDRAPDLDIRPSCWCPSCEADVEGRQVFKRPDARWGKYRSQYLYRCPTCDDQVLPYVWPALSALDLSHPFKRVGDLDLSAATLRRIEVGLERYGPAAMVQAAGHCFERPGYYRTWPAWQPLKAVTSTLQYGLALDRGFFVKNNGGMSEAHYRAHPLHAPLGSIVGSAINQSLVLPLDHPGDLGPQAAPALWPQRTQSGRAEIAVVVPNRTHNAPRGPGEPLAPLTTAHGAGHALAALPFVTELRGGSSTATSAIHPLATVVASDGQHHYVTQPPGVMVRMNGDLADAPSMSSPFDGPMGTVTGKVTQAVVPFLQGYYGTRAGSTPVTHPSPTLSSRDHHAVIDPRDVRVEDCGFRMMEPDEAMRAMAFPDSYKIEGSKRNRVRLAGQAVTPPASAVISARVIEALAS